MHLQRRGRRGRGRHLRVTIAALALLSLGIRSSDEPPVAVRGAGPRDRAGCYLTAWQAGVDHLAVSDGNADVPSGPIPGIGEDHEISGLGRIHGLPVVEGALRVVGQLVSELPVDRGREAWCNPWSLLGRTPPGHPEGTGRPCSSPPRTPPSCRNRRLYRRNRLLILRLYRRRRIHPTLVGSRKPAPRPRCRLPHHPGPRASSSSCKSRKPPSPTRPAPRLGRRDLSEGR